VRIPARTHNEHVIEGKIQALTAGTNYVSFTNADNRILPKKRYKLEFTKLSELDDRYAFEFLLTQVGAVDKSFDFQKRVYIGSVQKQPSEQEEPSAPPKTLTFNPFSKPPAEKNLFVSKLEKDTDILLIPARATDDQFTLAIYDSPRGSHTLGLRRWDPRDGRVETRFVLEGSSESWSQNFETLLENDQKLARTVRLQSKLDEAWRYDKSVDAKMKLYREVIEEDPDGKFGKQAKDRLETLENRPLKKTK
jgi:hypothetical protein